MNEKIIITNNGDGTCKLEHHGACAEDVILMLVVSATQVIQNQYKCSQVEATEVILALLNIFYRKMIRAEGLRGSDDSEDIWGDMEEFIKKTKLN